MFTVQEIATGIWLSRDRLSHICLARSLPSHLSSFSRCKVAPPFPAIGALPSLKRNEHAVVDTRMFAVQDHNEIELRGLRYFLQVARHGNFGRAAIELGIGQPAVSRQIRKLEEGLGTPLFLRHGRGVTLTTAGSLLLARLEAFMNVLPPASDPALQAPIDSRPLVWGFPERFAAIVPSVIKSFCAAFPTEGLSLRHGQGNTLEEWLLTRRIDVALLDDVRSLSGFSVQPLVRERLLLVFPPQSNLSELPAYIGFSNLTALPLILPTAQHKIRRILMRFGAQHRIEFHPTLETDSPDVAKAAVREGIGYAIMTPLSVMDELTRGVLCARPITKPDLALTSSLVLPQDYKEQFSAALLAECVWRAMTDFAVSRPLDGVDFLRRDVSSSD